jgi:hypothetical protein
MIAIRKLPADWYAQRQAALLAAQSTPEELAYRREHLDWMRRCAASTATGPRFAIGAEMDGRAFSAGEIKSAERALAMLEAHAAQVAA